MNNLLAAKLYRISKFSYYDRFFNFSINLKFANLYK